jgi:hypothetical protein
MTTALVVKNVERRNNEEIRMTLEYFRGALGVRTRPRVAFRQVFPRQLKAADHRRTPKALSREIANCH